MQCQVIVTRLIVYNNVHNTTHQYYLSEIDFPKLMAQILTSLSQIWESHTCEQITTPIDNDEYRRHACNIDCAGYIIANKF